MTAIPGATSSTYVPVTADIGQNITCTVTATNSAGNASATSAAVGPIAAVGAPLDGLSPTGAWSFSRKLLTAYAGGFYSATSSAVTLLNDQSGSARDLNDGSVTARRPTVATAGPLNLACATWNGTTNGLASSADLSTFINGDAGFVVISALATSIVRNSTNAARNDELWGDGGAGNTGMFLKNTGGGIGYSYNWDSAARVTPNSAVVTVGVPHVFAWRHDTGVLYFSIDGGVETSIAAATNTSVSGTKFYLGGDGTNNACLNGSIFEAAVWTTVPNSTNRAAIIASFKSWCGVAAVSYATWDPSTVAAVTLSGGNLVATGAG